MSAMLPNTVLRKRKKDLMIFEGGKLSSLVNKADTIHSMDSNPISQCALLPTRVISLFSRFPAVLSEISLFP